MSYPGDTQTLFDGPIGSPGNFDVIEAHDASRQYRIVDQADDGWKPSTGGKFARIEVAPGDTTGHDPGERCLVRWELPSFGGKVKPESQGDETFDCLACYLPKTWLPDDTWATWEGHGDGNHAGNFGLRFYAASIAFAMDCGWYASAVGVGDGSHNPQTRGIYSGPMAGHLHEFKRHIVWDGGGGAQNPNGGPGRITIVHRLDGGEWQTILDLPGPTLQNLAGKVGISYVEIGNYRPKVQSTDVLYLLVHARRATDAEIVALLDGRLHGAPVPTPTPSPSPTPVPTPKPAGAEPLDEFWRLMVATTPYKSTWLGTKAGQRDHAKLAAFAKGSNTVPTLETGFGKALLQTILARVPAGLPPYTGAV